jgi:hypothetical protein
MFITVISNLISAHTSKSASDKHRTSTSFWSLNQHLDKDVTQNNSAPFYPFHCWPHSYVLNNEETQCHEIQPFRLTFTVSQVCLEAFNFINPFPTSKPIKQVVLLILVCYNVLWLMLKRLDFYCHIIHIKVNWGNLGSEFVSMGKYFLMFQSIVMLSSSGTSSPRWLACLTLKVKARRCLGMLGTTHPATQCHKWTTGARQVKFVTKIDHECTCALHTKYCL